MKYLLILHPIPFSYPVIYRIPSDCTSYTLFLSFLQPCDKLLIILKSWILIVILKLKITSSKSSTRIHRCHPMSQLSWRVLDKTTNLKLIFPILYQHLYQIWVAFVCMFVCPMSPNVLLGNTPQFLSQMKSDLHKIFIVLEDWSPELINNVRAYARARVHAQHMETCTQLWAKNKSSHFM